MPEAMIPASEEGGLSMIKNMGSSDKIIRLILAIVFAVLYFAKIITGTLGIILIIIAVIFLVTSLVGFCPLYVPFKISTKKK